VEVRRVLNHDPLTWSAGTTEKKSTKNHDFTARAHGLPELSVTDSSPILETLGLIYYLQVRS
jgi:hypothetical protein